MVKYDQHPDYLALIQSLDGTKGVDIVAVNQPDRGLYLVEIKDFRGYRIENKGRVANGALAEEVAQKVRDTLAGIIAAHHRGGPEEWDWAVRRIMACDPPIRVLLWLEEDLSPRLSGRRAGRSSTLIDTLRKRLSWLTTKILVVSSRTGTPPPGLEVENLPGAGLPA